MPTPEMELGREELLTLVFELRAELKAAQERIASLEEQVDQLKKQNASGPDEEYSLKAEQQRQDKQAGKQRKKQKSARRGRRTTEEKLNDADRIQCVCPEDFDVEQCTLVSKRPVWRIEDGRAVLVAYHIYRGPGGEVPVVSGLLPRCEYGIEVFVTLAFEVFLVGLSMDKTIDQLEFFWGLKLRKSQVDSMLSRLAREWESEFETLCELLAASAVVYADETSWSINSVWAFLSKHARVLIFGCHKDGDTLAAILPKDTFTGVLVSDDAAVYRGFSRAQKCWAHLIRKAIKLTLTDPNNASYRRFLDGLLEVYREACRIKRDRRFSAAGREAKQDDLDEMLCELCGERYADESEPTSDAERDYRNLVLEIVRLMGDRELFTFVTHPDVDGTNNESERSLRDSTQARKTGRTSKTVRGARRRTIVTSVLESLGACLPTFTLSTVVDEATNWLVSGRSRFQTLAAAAGLTLDRRSILDALLPEPCG